MWYIFSAMPAPKSFELYESTVRAVRRCYNLVITAVSYAATILALTLLAVGFGLIMGRLAEIVGIDEKTQRLISALGASVFAILVLVSFALALADVAKLIRYYIRDWRENDGGERSTENGDPE